jgi:hypothetical protein
MKTIKTIFFYLFFGLSFLVRGQQIGNYVTNGSFEDYYSCYLPNHIAVAKGWRTVDSSLFGPQLFLSTCYPNVPYTGFGFQWPRTGGNLFIAGFFCEGTICSVTGGRGYIRNRLKSNLIQGKIYCVSFFVNISNNSQYGIDAFGAFFGDDSIDTITVVSTPLIYLNPQITNATNNIITDTLNWTLVTGTFVANGTEKHLIIGNFKSDTSTNKVQIDTTFSPYVFTDVCIDDVSCVEINLAAFAGKDTTIFSGDSIYIGRQPDFAIDPGCIWFKLPNMAIPLDTISGIWVKPTTTSTYVVRQVLDCSPLKWDTIVVTVSTNYVGLSKLQKLSDNISLFPNPTSGNLSISGFSGSGISSFSISNCLGQIIQSGDIIQKNNLINVETSELESGLYQIHLKTPYGIVTKKFVKTN